MSTGAPAIASSPPAPRRRRLVVDRPDWHGRRQWRDELSAYVMSFLVHLAGMIALTMTFVVQAVPGKPAPLTITTELPDESPLDDLPAEFTLQPPQVEDAPQLGPSMVAATAADASHQLDVAAVTAPPGGKQGAGTSSGPPAQTGSFLDLPKNAVQAGSFAAWWIPKAERYGEQVEAGQLPREGQDYRIYVQVLVPKEHKVYRVDDLSGEIVGTDGYKQIIPDRAFVLDEKGNLVPAIGARRYLPLRNGVAEIVFKVDAASKAGIQDLIRIHSRLLDEEQTLTLEFQPEKPERR